MLKWLKNKYEESKESRRSNFMNGSRIKPWWAFTKEQKKNFYKVEP